MMVYDQDDLYIVSPLTSIVLVFIVYPLNKQFTFLAIYTFKSVVYSS